MSLAMFRSNHPVLNALRIRLEDNLFYGILIPMQKCAYNINIVIILASHIRIKSSKSNSAKCFIATHIPKIWGPDICSLSFKAMNIYHMTRHIRQTINSDVISLR